MKSCATCKHADFPAPRKEGQCKATGKISGPIVLPVCAQIGIIKVFIKRKDGRGCPCWEGK